eukprot:scaffold4635_cov267-Pinguiococcus_pyrenoidosus.AAC.37
MVKSSTAASTGPSAPSEIFFLHMGHVARCLNHCTMQSSWKSCPHGRQSIRSPSWNAEMQTGHRFSPSSTMKQPLTLPCSP